MFSPTQKTNSDDQWKTLSQRCFFEAFNNWAQDAAEIENCKRLDVQERIEEEEEKKLTRM